MDDTTPMFLLINVCSSQYQLYFITRVGIWIFCFGSLLSLLWISIFRVLAVVYGLILPPSIDAKGQSVQHNNERKVQRSFFCSCRGCCCCFYWPLLLIFRCVERVYEICLLLPVHIIPSGIIALLLNAFIFMNQCILPRTNDMEFSTSNYALLLQSVTALFFLAIVFHVIIFTYIVLVWRKSQRVHVRLVYAFIMIPILVFPGMALIAHTDHEIIKGNLF